MEELKKRNSTRLENFDYSTNAAYFVTICTKDRKMLFAPVGADSKIVQSFKRYSTIEYSKMLKEGILPSFEKQIWQRGFYDHIIRNREDYEAIEKYICENPEHWYYDELYSGD